MFYQFFSLFTKKKPNLFFFWLRQESKFSAANDDERKLNLKRDGIALESKK